MNKKELLFRAKTLAHKAHDKQTRWGGEPYIVHPERVAARLSSYGPSVVAIGWLHDVVEDTDVTLDDIEQELGANISKKIEIITHRPSETYAEYIERIGQNFVATLVKLADLEDNLSDLDNSPRNRQRRQKYELARLYLKTVQEIV